MSLHEDLKTQTWFSDTGSQMRHEPVSFEGMELQRVMGARLCPSAALAPQKVM